MRFSKKINNHGFTLFELIVSMTIFSLIMITVLESVVNIGIARTRSVTRINLLEELYFFSEKLATSIKDGGIIDYEEYWNRQAVGTGTATGHYLLPTGFWDYGSGGILSGTNYGAWFYYCRSGGTAPTKIGTGGCLTGNNSNIVGGTPNINYSWAYQRYGQYKLQYTDYNGNNDSDLGDEDSDASWSIRWDEDDKDIGDGPIVLSGSSPELYLYNPLTKERTFFRWTYRQDDPTSPTSCIMATGSGCIGNIEILRLKWLDIGMNHSGQTLEPWVFDGMIDTWICHVDWPCTTGPTLPSNVWGGRIPTWSDSEWIKMFPDYIDVRKLSFDIYPRKDPWRSWAAIDCIWGSCPAWFISPFIQPYVRIQMTLGLAWEKRKIIRWDDPTITISTTVSLSHTNIE